jgi:hypothetical protein
MDSSTYKLNVGGNFDQEALDRMMDEEMGDEIVYWNEYTTGNLTIEFFVENWFSFGFVHAN